MAEGSANIFAVQVAGKDPAGSPFTYIFFSSGGTGARATKDGLSATAFPSGVLGTPAEVIESLSPLLVEKKELRPGSGGAGKYRGGLGQTVTLRVRTDEPFTCSVLCDRTRVPARGFFGGQSGATAQVLIDGRPPVNPKAEQLLAPDSVVEIRLPGGGGYGRPEERDPESIRRDLREGYVTPVPGGVPRTPS
jgi:N-methylhydantoinase B